MSDGAFGVWCVGKGWMHCPISGEQIRGSRSRMRLYAADMALLTHYVRSAGHHEALRFVCRRVA